MNRCEPVYFLHYLPPVLICKLYLREHLMTEERARDKISVILIADPKGYIRLMDQNEAGPVNISFNSIEDRL